MCDLLRTLAGNQWLTTYQNIKTDTKLNKKKKIGKHTDRTEKKI